MSELRLPLDQLYEREGWNVRLADDPDNIAHIEELAKSIAEVGVLEPLTVYAEKMEDGKERHIIINGHNRLAASKLAVEKGAPLKNIPVRIVSKRDKEDDHVFGMIARNSGKQLSPLELGIACLRLVKFGWSEADLAVKTGKTLQTINNVLTLASAAPEVTRLVETGHVSATLAVQTIATEGEQAGAVLVEAVEIAKTEEEAKPEAKKRGRPPGVSGKTPVVKATLKHVRKTKGAKLVRPKARGNYGNRNVIEPVGELIAKLQAMPVVQSLAVFDKLTKSRGEVYQGLLTGLLCDPEPVENGGDHNEGNGRAPDLTTLGLLFGRATSARDDSDPDLTTIIMDTDAWETACRLLKIQQPEEGEGFGGATPEPPLDWRRAGDDEQQNISTGDERNEQESAAP